MGGVRGHLVLRCAAPLAPCTPAAYVSRRYGASGRISAHYQAWYASCVGRRAVLLCMDLWKIKWTQIRHDLYAVTANQVASGIIYRYGTDINVVY